jgi:hypothetical protein
MDDHNGNGGTPELFCSENAILLTSSLLCEEATEKQCAISKEMQIGFCAINLQLES